MKEIYDSCAKQCFERLLKRIAEEAPHHEKDVLDVLSLQLSGGPLSWSETDRKKMKHLLQVNPAVVTPVIEATMNDLKQCVCDIADKQDRQALVELRTSLLVCITQYQVTQVRDKLTAWLGGTLTVLCLISAGGIGYTLLRLLGTDKPHG